MTKIRIFRTVDGCAEFLCDCYTKMKTPHAIKLYATKVRKDIGGDTCFVYGKCDLLWSYENGEWHTHTTEVSYV